MPAAADPSRPIDPRTPPWVLLRGLTRERAHWGDFGDRLEAAIPGARVLAVDLPGTGLRWREPSPATIEGILHACRASLEAAGEHPPYRLLALSLGAMVAVRWMHAFPAEVERCVLVNTSLRPPSPPWRRMHPRAWPVVAARLLRGGTPRQWEETVLALTSNDPARRAAALPAWIAVREARPVSRSTARRQLWAAARWRAPRERPPVPLLLLASTADALVDVACPREVARRWSVPLVEHPWAGHDLPLDDPAWVAARAAEWARREAATDAPPA